MKLFLTVLIILISGLSWGQCKYYVPEVSKKGKVGLYYMGELVLKHNNDQILTKEHMAIVEKDGHFTIYGEEMKALHEGDYDELIGIDGWMTFIKDGKIKVLSLDLQHTIELGELIGERRAVVIHTYKDTYGMINGKGEVTVPFEYDNYLSDPDLESNGLFHLKKDGVSHFVNEEGIVVFKGTGSVWAMQTKNAYAFEEDGKYGIFSANGEYNIPLRKFKYVKDITASESPKFAYVHDYYVVMRRNKGGWEFALINQQGEKHYGWTYDEMWYSCGKYSCNPDKYIFIRKEGDSCIIANHELTEQGRVKADGFVNMKISPFIKNYIFVDDGKLVEFDKNSLQLAEQNYYKTGERQIIKTAEEKYGLVDSNLNVLLPFVYDYLSELDKDYPELYIVSNFQPKDFDYPTVGIISTDGKYVIRPEYKELDRVKYNGFEHILIVKNYENQVALAMIQEDGKSIKWISEFVVSPYYTAHGENGKVWFETLEGKKLYTDQKGNISIKD